MADITKILFRRDYLANWKSVNPVLSLGEPGVAINDNEDLLGFKIGDGNTHWIDLDWQTGDLSSTFSAIAELQQEVETLDNTVNNETTGLTVKVGALENDINDEETGLSAIASTVNALSESVSTNTTDISNLDRDKEDVSNKVTSLSNSSTDDEYPSAKCVYDEIEIVLGGQIDTLNNTINSISTKVPNPPNVSGTYTLKCEVDTDLGTITYE